MSRKRRYGRLQKAMGDVSLLAGSPSDAADHYATALELARISSDGIWAGAALEGIASAKASFLDSGRLFRKHLKYLKRLGWCFSAC